MSLRHRKAARVLEKRLDDNERMQEWHREEHRRRQQQLMTRGVTRENAQLLPEDPSDPLPTPIMEDLADFRPQTLREELVSRRTKAKEAFQGPWLQSTERTSRNYCKTAYGRSWQSGEGISRSVLTLAPRETEATSPESGLQS